MIQKRFDEITKSHIDALIADRVCEFKTLEYKQELPGKRPSERKEFLADVSSFANASGGDIVYGLKAAEDEGGNKTGAPESVLPITGVTADQAKLRLEQMIQNGIAPRLPVQVKGIEGWGDGGRGFVILIRIPDSFASPHMVKFDGTSKFYSRNSASRYQLDVDELRMAFLAAESQAQRIRGFLADRIASIHSGDTPVRLKAPDRVVLHVIPTSFFLSTQRLHLLDQSTLRAVFSPSYHDNCRYTLDGLLTSAGPSDQVSAYCQIMFNGCVELVKSGVMHERDNVSLVPDILRFKGYTDRLYDFLIGLKGLDVPAPFLVHAAILGCADGIVDAGKSFASRDYVGVSIYQLGKDVVLLPEVVLNEFPADKNDFQTMLKPIGDGLFNASGMPQHNGYDDEGKWPQ